MPAPPKVDVLGVGVSAVNLPMALDIVEQWIQQRTPNYVCLTGVHGVMESWRARELRAVHNTAGLVAPDGMPLAWLARRAFRHVSRVYGPDLMAAMCERSRARGYRHFLYGSTPETLQRLQAALHRHFRGLNIVGAYAPPFSPLGPDQDAREVELINASQPDLVWVGLSTPKQERWMASHVGRVRAPVLLGVGAAFDFLAGVKPQAPRWMMTCGLEWLFRLACEPRRLGPRYLLNNPFFLLLLALRAVRGKPLSSANRGE
jgi:N-acetylglucosaminyldiphosphoundecaprenol N-acetyl-beta-D-mannosaminyltransferase